MISVRIFDPPAWDIDEISRYSRADMSDESSAALIRECIAEAEPTLSYKVSYTVADVVRDGDDTVLGNIRTPSATLKKALGGCERALVFAATVGTPFDRLIGRYSAVSPSKALILQAIGAERVEALCDMFSEAFSRENGVRLRPRVSPGYGDIALELQRDFFALLDCPRKIGLTLNGSLIMSPSKSVTAVAGILTDDRGTDGASCTNRCAACGLADCRYRK